MDDVVPHVGVVVAQRQFDDERSILCSTAPYPYPNPNGWIGREKLATGTNASFGEGLVADSRDWPDLGFPQALPVHSTLLYSTRLDSKPNSS